MMPKNNEVKRNLVFEEITKEREKVEYWKNDNNSRGKTRTDGII